MPIHVYIYIHICISAVYIYTKETTPFCGVFPVGALVLIRFPSWNPGLACRDRKQNAMNINTHQACVVTTATGADFQRMFWVGRGICDDCKSTLKKTSDCCCILRINVVFCSDVLMFFYQTSFPNI